MIAQGFSDYFLNRKTLWMLVVLVFLVSGDDMLAQKKKSRKSRRARISIQHEIAPFIGLYAPDRFDNSFAYGVRYFYRLDARHTAGLLLGFAAARQDFVRKVSGIAPVSGSERLLYHAVRITRDVIMRSRIQPYMVGQFGLTQVHDENNFTVAAGVGTRIMRSRTLNMRYEIILHVYRSGANNLAWTNTNLEFSFAFGYYLQ